MIKRITKFLLVLSLLLTGVILTPTRISAEDIEPYASAVNMWTSTEQYYVNLGLGGSIYLKPKFSYIEHQTDTEMSYHSVTCSVSSADTCVVRGYVRSDATYCSLNTSNALIVDFAITTTKDGDTYTKYYRLLYRLNALVSKSFITAIGVGA